jgi:hypothetical protein
LSALISLYKVWSTPDILFKELKIKDEETERLGIIMSDYLSNDKVMQVQFEEGFKLLDISNKILTDENTSSYNKLAITLSVIAISISIIVALFL